MFLSSISLINFKNFEERSFRFDQRINCLVGNNGVGKTNVLDAIYYLSHTKGYFNAVASQNIKHGKEFFVVDGVYLKEDREEHIHCSLKKGSKKVFKRNGKEYEKLSDHFGLIPLVIISPSDTNLISEGSEFRSTGRSFSFPRIRAVLFSCPFRLNDLSKLPACLIWLMLFGSPCRCMTFGPSMLSSVQRNSWFR